MATKSTHRAVQPPPQPAEPRLHLLTFKSAPYGYGRCLACGGLVNALTLGQTPCEPQKEPTR